MPSSDIRSDRYVSADKGKGKGEGKGAPPPRTASTTCLHWPDWPMQTLGGFDPGWKVWIGDLPLPNFTQERAFCRWGLQIGL